MIDGSLLEEYMATLYGYGTYSGKTWFVGMEEGGGGSSDEITLRLEAWKARGKPELSDVSVFRRTNNHDLYKWFEPSPPIQSTWGKVIKIALHAHEKKVTPDAVRYFQSSKLGRTAGDTCILELLPLPSPGKKDWFYGQWTTLPQLASRRTYEAAWRTRRAMHIHQRIVEHQPQLVLFYGGGDRHTWEGVIGQKLIAANGLAGLYTAKIGRTLCAFTGLPQAMSESAMQAIGSEIGMRLAKD